jgi:hypothetical protein
MELGLSSAAAPDATLRELISVCARRGLRTLELRADDAHGLGPARGFAGLLEVREQATAEGVSVCAFRSDPLSGHEAAMLTQELGARLLLDRPADLHARIAEAARLRGAGGEVAMVVAGASAAADALAVAAADLDVAWDAVAGADALGEISRRLTGELGERLAHICLFGAGPESTLNEGSGIAELMQRLALSRYGGGVVLAPSSERYRVIWHRWLGRRGGWGCGSKVGTRTLVPLVGTVGVGRGDR